MVLGLAEDVKFHVFERKNSNRLGETEEIVREDGTERQVTTDSGVCKTDFQNEVTSALTTCSQCFLIRSILS